MNRSSCDSGNGKVPAKSCGFCVATTKNGSASGNALAVDGDLTVVHRFEQRGLRARAGAVDLVGKKHVREDRALSQKEIVGPLVEHRHTEHVARQEVARELHATHLAAHRFGQSACERRLADARDVLDQHVAASEQRDQRQLHHGGLSLQGALHGTSKLSEPFYALGLDGDRRGGHRAHRSTAAGMLLPGIPPWSWGFGGAGSRRTGGWPIPSPIVQCR